MYEYYFTFLSVTAAQRGMTDLLQRGIYAELVRTPRRVAENGCGYALKVKAGDGYGASSVLKLSGVNPVKVLRMFSDGRIEVARL